MRKLYFLTLKQGKYLAAGEPSPEDQYLL